MDASSLVVDRSTLQFDKQGSLVLRGDSSPPTALREPLPSTSPPSSTASPRADHVANGTVDKDDERLSPQSPTRPGMMFPTSSVEAVIAAHPTPPRVAAGGPGPPLSFATAVASSTPTTTSAPTAAPPATAVAPSAKRLYRLADNKWVTRDLAALDFLLGIPLQREAEIVHHGWARLQKQKTLEHEYGGGDSDYSSGGNDNRAVVVLPQRLATQHPQQQPHQLQQQLHQPQQWWEKWVKASLQLPPSTVPIASDQLERPTQEEKGDLVTATNRGTTASAAGTLLTATTLHNYAPPGRRLEGDKATYVKIPVTTVAVSKQKSVARAAALREWELRTAHGLVGTAAAKADGSSLPPLLDGRLFFSASGGYPISVFSLQRYEPRKEEAALRRQKLEALGGGGSQYVMPFRDWRGISYRALLPRSRDKDHFNRFLKSSSHMEGGDDADDATSVSSESSDDSDVYVPGLLDDPEMVLGRHRTVMIGDRVTGPIVASTIQFVEPALLKADLNKQFRERFEGWEPPRAARKYIGARVVDGNYTLMDPAAAAATAANNDDDGGASIRTPRQGSVASASSTSDTAGGGGGGGAPTKEKQTIRMPPSLTLSKIRSLKNQALKLALKANLEIGTVALACVYFERLCLDCRVDKSNRRVSMAACLLLASKINEPNIGLVYGADETTTSGAVVVDGGAGATATNPATSAAPASKLLPFARLNKKSNTIFSALLEFFTVEWSLSLQHLFTAEWGVFAALGFSLLAEPSQVAFHFKRLMKTLELSPRNYLGDEMYDQWQESLADEEDRRKERERRRERLRQLKEEKLLSLHLEIENDRFRRQTAAAHDDDLQCVGLTDPPSEQHRPRHGGTGGSGDEGKTAPEASPGGKNKKAGGIGFLHRLTMRRVASSEVLHPLSLSEHHRAAVPPSLAGSHPGGSGAAGASRLREGRANLPCSPSLPVIANVYIDPATLAIDMPDLEQRKARSETSSIGSAEGSEDGGIVV